MASEKIREIQERRRSSAASPVERPRKIGNLDSIQEQLEDLDDEFSGGYCTKDGCFSKNGNPV